jgi:large conductance mechanosensitive channel
MGFTKEFKEFALKGSVVDLALGVVIGGAFGGVVKSFTDNILMPPIGLLTGHEDFSSHFITLSGGHFATLAQAKAAGATTLNYGLFVNSVITFLIVALALFIVIKKINAIRRQPAPETPTTRDCPECLSSIPRLATRCRYCTTRVQS